MPRRNEPTRQVQMMPISATHLREVLSLSEQIQQLGDDLLALSRIHLRVIEFPGLLEDEALLNAVKRRVLRCRKGPDRTASQTTYSSISSHPSLKPIPQT